MNRIGIRRNTGMLIAVLTAIVLSYEPEATAQSSGIPPSITTPDKVETRIGTMEFKDGMPSKGTVDKIYDNLTTKDRPGRLLEEPTHAKQIIVYAADALERRAF